MPPPIGRRNSWFGEHQHHSDFPHITKSVIVVHIRTWLHNTIMFNGYYSMNRWMAASQTALARIVPANQAQSWLPSAIPATHVRQVPLPIAYQQDRQHVHHSERPQIQGTKRCKKWSGNDILRFSERVVERIRTSLGFAGSENRRAATKNMSGAGFPILTSGSVVPITLWWNSENSSWCLDILISAISWLELVASAKGTFLACRWRISRSAPKI